ncbi:MAG: hypothetical protein R3B96_03355 [Pirellulaceae bacterium]
MGLGRLGCWVAPLALGAFLGLPSVEAQVRIPVAAFEPVSNAETLLADVERLEGEGRWSEVLSLLERARREDPTN